jgi:pilus assembly protein CpaB
MNVMRFGILAIALIAATAAVFLARGMLGGGTPASQAATPSLALTEVLVASKDIAPGHVLDAGSVRWEQWPKSSVPGTFITKDAQPDAGKAVEGMVVRAPLVAGQPIGEGTVVHAGTAGFLAATIKPGLRAIALNVTAETSAGGFILPNDRVDVVLTRDISNGSGKKQFETATLLRDVRVLAIDQSEKQEKDKDSILGKTATLELTPAQSEVLAQAEQLGVVSLALRALGDSTGEPATPEKEQDKSKEAKPAVVAAIPRRPRTNEIVVFRYGRRGGAAPSASAENTPSSTPPATVAPTAGTETDVGPVESKVQ